MSQVVGIPPTAQKARESLVQSTSLEDLLEEMCLYSVFLPGEHYGQALWAKVHEVPKSRTGLRTNAFCFSTSSLPGPEFPTHMSSRDKFCSPCLEELEICGHRAK